MGGLFIGLGIGWCLRSVDCGVTADGPAWGVGSGRFEFTFVKKDFGTISGFFTGGLGLTFKDGFVLILVAVGFRFIADFDTGVGFCCCLLRILSLLFLNMSFRACDTTSCSVLSFGDGPGEQALPGLIDFSDSVDFCLVGGLTEEFLGGASFDISCGSGRGARFFISTSLSFLGFFFVGDFDSFFSSIVQGVSTPRNLRAGLGNVVIGGGNGVSLDPKAMSSNVSYRDPESSSVSTFCSLFSFLVSNPMMCGEIM